MKKLIKCLFALMLVFGLSACSGSEEEKENIRLAVDSYLANCKTGDYEAADAFLTEDADDSLGTAQIYEQLDSQLADLGLGDDFDREARAFTSSVISAIFKEYKIDSTEIAGDTAKVEVTLKGIDENSFDLNAVQLDAMNEVNTYLQDNEQELQTYAQNHTEDELTAKISADLSKIVFGQMTTYVVSLPDSQTNLQFDMKKTDGSWKIASIMEKSAQQ